MTTRNYLKLLVVFFGLGSMLLAQPVASFADSGSRAGRSSIPYRDARYTRHHRQYRRFTERYPFRRKIVVLPRRATRIVIRSSPAHYSSCRR